jgi:hypothetical protein
MRRKRMVIIKNREAGFLLDIEAATVLLNKL